MADVLIVGFEDGTFYLSIYDLFELGLFSIKPLFDQLTHCQPLLHCFHPFSTTHSLLVRTSDKTGDTLSLLPVDLRLLSNAGRYLSTLASKSTQMRNLLRYIRQVQIQMYGDFKACLELPKRFMANIEETLDQEGEWSWSQAAYHVVVTGHCPKDIKEWLLDQLGERVITDHQAMKSLLLT